jgi:hypothetical protein
MSGSITAFVQSWWVPSRICSVLGRPDRVQRGYMPKLGHWPTHEFGACEIPLVHNVVLSGDVLRLTGYVP